MEENKENAANKEKQSDAMTKEEADRVRVLIKEDIAKYELEIARHEAAVGQFRTYIAECRAALADVDRREAGVAYPEPPKPAAAPAAPDAEAK